jgi:hypothetical protein
VYAVTEGKQRIVGGTPLPKRSPMLNGDLTALLSDFVKMPGL